MYLLIAGRNSTDLSLVRLTEAKYMSRQPNKYTGTTRQFQCKEATTPSITVLGVAVRLILGLPVP